MERYNLNYPSIFYPLNLVQGHGSAGQLPVGERRGTHWICHKSITEIHINKQPYMLILSPRVNLETPINLACVFEWWEEAGVPGENLRIQGENMQTQTSEAPVLTTTPPCLNKI